jgi:hypothetical protein
MPQKSAQAGMEEEAPVTEIKKASDIIPRSSPSRQVPARRLEISDSQATIPETIPSQNSDNKAPDLYLTDEKLFKKHLVELAASLEEELIVNFNPIICGRTIPLFKLWQVVRSQELGGYDEVTGRNLWTQVARKLNFSDFQHPDAHLDLKMCYEEILADFEGWLDYKETQPDLTESQENAMIESQLRRTAERETQNVGEDIAEEDGDEDYDDDLDAPSSMPQPLKSSPKRIFGDDRSSQGPTSIKRQRIDKGKGKELEVPSTPEDVINSNRMPRPSYQQSPLNLASTVIGVDDEDELLLRPIPRPNFSGASNAHQKRAFEPETQDFHFPLPDNDDRGPFESLSSSNRKRILDGSNSGTTRRAPIDEDDAGPAASIPSRIQRRPDSGSNVVTYERFVDDSSTQSLTQSQRETELRAFIDRYVALGYSYDIVIDALEATTMETGDAGLVMEQLTNGGGIPENHQGVWTAWDDEALQADDDSEEFRRLLEKHGMKRVLTRHKFLDDLKEVRRESEGILD